MGRKDWLAMRSSSWNGWRRSLVFFLPFLFILLNLFYGDYPLNKFPCSLYNAENKIQNE
jgi:hypothetical protein